MPKAAPLTAPWASTPVACRVHGEATAPSGDEYTATGRRPASSGGVDTDLQPHRALAGQGQGLVDGELFDVVAADLVARADRELHEAAAGQRHHTAHAVFGQPRVRCHGQPAGEHHLVGSGHAHCRAQQRVFGGGQAEPGRVAAGAAPGAGPVALVLEGVGRQTDAPGAGAGEEALPVDGHAAQVEQAERGDGGVLFRPVPS
ncbi:hypothetical protein GCM10020000_05540 [Streptomyces olivoverticillatus]